MVQKANSLEDAVVESSGTDYKVILGPDVHENDVEIFFLSNWHMIEAAHLKNELIDIRCGWIRIGSSIYLAAVSIFGSSVYVRSSQPVELFVFQAQLLEKPESLKHARDAMIDEHWSMLNEIVAKKGPPPK